MNAAELLKMFLQLPELSTVGKPKERAAFIALRVDRRTVREAARVIGISKSNVQNLADLFQQKLRKKMVEMGKKGAVTSSEYRRLYAQLLELMPYDYDWAGHKIGNFEPGKVSREDWAEVRGGVKLTFDDE